MVHGMPPGPANLVLRTEYRYGFNAERGWVWRPELAEPKDQPVSATNHWKSHMMFKGIESTKEKRRHWRPIFSTESNLINNGKESEAAAQLHMTTKTRIRPEAAVEGVACVRAWDQGWLSLLVYMGRWIEAYWDTSFSFYFNLSLYFCLCYSPIAYHSNLLS